MGELVEISKAELDHLKDEVDFLNCLRAAGVDNWDGYDDAIQIYHEGT